MSSLVKVVIHIIYNKPLVSIIGRKRQTRTAFAVGSDSESASDGEGQEEEATLQNIFKYVKQSSRENRAIRKELNVVDGKADAAVIAAAEAKTLAEEALQFVKSGSTSAAGSTAVAPSSTWTARRDSGQEQSKALDIKGFTIFAGTSGRKRPTDESCLTSKEATEYMEHAKLAFTEVDATKTDLILREKIIERAA